MIVKKTRRLFNFKNIYKKVLGSKKKINLIRPLPFGDKMDYRRIHIIKNYINKQGKILSRRKNKLSLKQQRLITCAIKQARNLSLLPFFF